MKWEMSTEEVEAVLERIWDLHDKVSDAIHAISRAHFLSSVKPRRASPPHPPPPPSGEGFVFVKGFDHPLEDAAAALAEARSLNGIRSALENLEDQLEIFHTVQSQQRAERDGAIARLEQSLVILAMRLADHQGKKYKVIEEASTFVGNAHGTGCFVSSEKLYEMSGENMNYQDGERRRRSVWMQMFISSLELAKKSFKFQRMGDLLGIAALFAVSMLALLQQVAYKCETSQAQQAFYRLGSDKKVSQPQNSRIIQLKHFDVFSARG